MNLTAAQIPDASTGAGLIALAIAAVLIVGLIIWHRRSPSGFAKGISAVETETKADVVALGHKALDIARSAVTKVPTAVQAPAAPAPGVSGLPGSLAAFAGSTVTTAQQAADKAQLQTNNQTTLA